MRKITAPEEKEVFAKWGKKGKYLVVVAVCLGLLALIWPQGKSVPRETANLVSQNSSGVAQVKANLASELENILSQVEGAGKVQVSLTLSSDGLKSYARNTKNERRETQEIDKSGGDRNIKEDNQTSDIAVSGGAALLVEDSAPEVIGVLVVADGAGNGHVKEKLTNATITLLNISPHQVRVVARKGDNQ
jgi:stage III sporulation protein AG